MTLQELAAAARGLLDLLEAYVDLALCFAAIAVPIILIRALFDWLKSFFPTPEHLQRRRPKVDAHPVVQRMVRLARPTLLLTATKSPVFSKIGGTPELPSGGEWPRGEAGPLAFLAQLDLAEVRAAGGPEWLPEVGGLWFFWNPERAGFPDEVRVLFSSHADRQPAAAPADLHRKRLYGERRAGFLRMTSLPSLEWLGLDFRQIDFDEDDREQLRATADADFGDELQHRISGYPEEIQEACMRLACEHAARGLPDPTWGADVPETIERASKSWRLLMQIDSDPQLKMEFGDSGRLYVFVRQQHAAKGEFAKTVAISQCY